MKNSKKNKLKPTNIYVPAELVPYNLVGYVQGDKIIKGQGVTLLSFDSIEIIHGSNNQLNGKSFIHAYGKLNTISYFLILELKK